MLVFICVFLVFSVCFCVGMYEQSMKCLVSDAVDAMSLSFVMCSVLWSIHRISGWTSICFGSIESVTKNGAHFAGVNLPIQMEIPIWKLRKVERKFQEWNAYVWCSPHPNTCAAIVAMTATAVVTPTVHRFNLNALEGVAVVITFSSANKKEGNKMSINYFQIKKIKLDRNE